MTDFLSLYSGTEQVDLGNGFHVEVRRCLSAADYADAQKAMMPDRKLKVEGGQNNITASIDTSGYTQVLMERAIVSWNLTQSSGDLPLTPETIKALPNPVYNKILTRVNELNEEDTPAERATFPV